MSFIDDRNANAVPCRSSLPSPQKSPFTSPSRRRSSSGGGRASQSTTLDRTYAQSASASSVSAATASPVYIREQSWASSTDEKQTSVVKQDLQQSIPLSTDTPGRPPKSAHSHDPAICSGSAKRLPYDCDAAHSQLINAANVPIESVNGRQDMIVEFATANHDLIADSNRDVTYGSTGASSFPSQTSDWAGSHTPSDDERNTSPKMLVDSPHRISQDNLLRSVSASSAGWPDPKRLHLTGHGWLSNALVGDSEPSDLALGAVIGWTDPSDQQYHLEENLVAFDINADFRDLHKTRQSPLLISSATSDQLATTTNDRLASVSETENLSARTQASKLISYSSAVSTTASSASHQQSQQPLSASFSNANSVAGTTHSQPYIKPFLTTAAELAVHRPYPSAMYDVQKHQWHFLCCVPNNDTGFIPEVYKCRGVHASHFYIPLERAIDPKFILRTSQVQAAHLDGIGGPSDASWPNPNDLADQCWTVVSSEPSQLWRLFVCSACKHAVASSSHHNAFPGVLRDLWRPFVISRHEELSQEHADRNEAPPTTRQKLVTIQQSLEYLWKVLRNLLYQAETQGIPKGGATYVRRMGRSLAALNIFLRLGFTKSTHQGKEILNAPLLNHTTCLVLARAFLEVSICIAKSHNDLHQPNVDPSAVGNSTPPAAQLVKLLKPRDVLFTQFGRGRSIPLDSDQWSSGSAAQQTFQILGFLPDTPDDVAAFAYGAQVSSDADRASIYYDALLDLRERRPNLDGNDLDILAATEQSKGRLGYSELVQYLRQVGFEAEDIFTDTTFFGVPELRLLNEDRIAREYQKTLMSSQEQSDASAVKRLAAANSAIRAILRTLPNAELLEAMVVSSEERNHMPSYTLAEAYKRLECPEDIDDPTLCTFAQVWLSEADAVGTPKLRAALQTIANHRNSILLKQLLQPEAQSEAIVAASEAIPEPSLPPGLVNIGNTCYLNSLLQYLFTIVPLRHVIVKADSSSAAMSDSELIRQKRVGGRQITLRELERSRQFVSELSQLFTTLATVTAPAVQPAKELAYLALVSSRDEDDDGVAIDDNAAIDGQHISMPLRAAASAAIAGASMSGPIGSSEDVVAKLSNQATSPSVLGKRNSDHLLPDNPEISVAAHHITSAPDVAALVATGETAEQSFDGDDYMMAQEAPDGVIEILHSNDERVGKVSQPPALPPRSTVRNISSQVNPNMMFGKQNDVAEAMDNVIFQLEVGISDHLPSSDESTESDPIRYLFKGVSRQSLRPLEPDAELRHKEEEFSYLLIDIPHEGLDIYDGIDTAFSTSIVTLNDKEVERTDSLLRLPPILQIQLQRVQFDKATSRIYKSNAFMNVPDTLLMHRFMLQSADAQLDIERRERTQALGMELRTAQQALRDRSFVNENQQTSANILREAVDDLRQLYEASTDPAVSEYFRSSFTSLAIDGSVEPPLHATLNDIANHLDEQTAALRLDIDRMRQDIAALWPNDNPDYEYELASVFMHSGAAGYGHYYLYQKALPDSATRWLKFNDATVTDVPAVEVFGNTSGQAANPYWLAYVRKSHIAEYIQAVRQSTKSQLFKHDDEQRTEARDSRV